MMQRTKDTLIEHHFALYQSLLGLIGAVAVIHILSNYSWKVSIGYGSMLVASFWVGQAVFSLIQRNREARSSRSID